jgi:nitrite reductase/ring-hydroxylating ferredoxin subunit/uncharacterized membrane protein
MLSRANIKSHPMHPMLVAFPIGLWITSLVLDAIGAWRDNATLWSAGWICIVAGCIGAAAAALPGLIDLLTVVPPNSSAKKRGYLHGGLNSLMLLLFIAVAWYRGGPAARPDGLSLLLSVAGVIGIAVSGWLGATLVYRNQIGVDHRYANAGKWRERDLPSWDRPVCNEGELAYGQMMLARVGSERVVVGRCNEGIVAFSDHCTHKGGPLSDGVIAGCAVQCPWHGSQFDVKTGRVIAGPAEDKITVYDIRISSGEVWVVPKVDSKPDKKSEERVA